MAKVRVYELAKDLNMTNRALLNMIRDLDIEIKSHMSSLEDSAVKEIKNNLFGKAKQKNDLKVKPSVIRRRKKMVAREPMGEEDSPLEPAAHDSEQADARTDTAMEKHSPDTPKVQPVADDLRSDAEKPVEISETPAESTKKPTPVSKKKPSEPARIIQPIKAHDPEPPVKEKVLAPKSDQSEKTTSLEPATLSEAPKKAETKEETRVEKDTEEKVSKKTIQEPATAEEPIEKTDTESIKPGTKKEQPLQPETDEMKALAKKKKKKRKSMPAKIVKKADPAVLENIRKTKSEEDKDKKGMDTEKIIKPVSPARVNAAVERPGPGMPFIPGEAEPGPRKKDRRKDEAADDSFETRRKKRKKKSVVEGEDLYRGRGKKKRGKKDTRGKKGGFQKTQITVPKAIKRRIKIDEAIELAELDHGCYGHC